MALVCSLLVSAQEAGQSLKELQEAVRMKPDDAEAHARLGIHFRRLSRSGEAIESLERAVKLEPRQSRVKVLLAFSYMDASRFDEAIPLLAASFDAEQKETVKLAVGQRLLECYLATGARVQALPVVNKLRELAPDDPAVLYLASKLYMNLWNDAFQTMLAKAPDSYQLNLIQAEALEAQERYAEAAQQYREILKKAQLPGIHYRLGVTLMRSGTESDPQALMELQKELERDAAHAAALTAIGEIHLRNNRRADAASSFGKAAKLQPNHAPARVGLAKVLIAEKQWLKALAELEPVAKLAPADEAVHYNLMLAYRGLGRTAEAKQAAGTLQRLKEERQRAGAALLKAQ
jgi:Flp pilus assembly protein TadD